MRGGHGTRQRHPHGRLIEVARVHTNGCHGGGGAAQPRARARRAITMARSPLPARRRRGSRFTVLRLTGPHTRAPRPPAPTLTPNPANTFSLPSFNAPRHSRGALLSSGMLLMRLCHAGLRRRGPGLWSPRCSSRPRKKRSTATPPRLPIGGQPHRGPISAGQAPVKVRSR